MEIPKGERVRKEKMENQEPQRRSAPKEEILERAKKIVCERKRSRDLTKNSERLQHPAYI